MSRLDKRLISEEFSSHGVLGVLPILFSIESLALSVPFLLNDLDNCIFLGLLLRSSLDLCSDLGEGS